MFAVLIIGDEILSGQVKDENLPYIIETFTRAGYTVGEARIVGDNTRHIAEAVKALSGTYDFVVTSGGVGPTHDDVTLAGVAHAFDVPLELHAGMEHFLKSHYHSGFNEAVGQMAMLPKGAEITIGEDHRWPVIRMNNCYVLPGLPVALRDKVRRILKSLPPLATNWIARLYLRADESVFAGWLKELQARQPEVSVGSYPKIGEDEYQVQVTLKSSQQPALFSAFAETRDYFKHTGWLVNAVPPEALR